jgi:hypothetical protein
MANVAVGPKQELYRKSYGAFQVVVESLTKHRVIVYTMSGYCMPEFIDPYIDDLVACAREHRPQAMIADARQMKVLSKEFQAAVQARFWPAIAKLGVKKNPGVVPEAALTAQSVHRMVRTAEEMGAPRGNNLEIALFRALEPALDWIVSAQDGQKSG